MSRAPSPEVAAKLLTARCASGAARHQGIEPCCPALETRLVPDGSVESRHAGARPRDSEVPPEGLEPSPTTFVASRPIPGTVAGENKRASWRCSAASGTRGGPEPHRASPEPVDAHGGSSRETPSRSLASVTRCSLLQARQQVWSTKHLRPVEISRARNKRPRGESNPPLLA